MEEKVNKVNLDSRSMVRNLCSWDLYFNNINYPGDVVIKANATLSILNSEIASQCSNNNIFFVGTDGQGSHARVYVENPELRIYVGFDSEDGKRKQNILTDEKCKNILELKTQKAFEKRVQEEIITDPEKEKILSYAKKIKINDYGKISFLEEYTGKKFRE